MLRLNVWIALSLSTLPLAAQMDRAALTGIVSGSQPERHSRRQNYVRTVATGIDYATSGKLGRRLYLHWTRRWAIHGLHVGYRVRDTSSSEPSRSRSAKPVRSIRLYSWVRLAPTLR